MTAFGASSYPIYQAAISVHTRPDNSDKKLIDRHDIVKIRAEDTHPWIGQAERAEFLWLRLEGLEKNDWWTLKESLYEDETMNHLGVHTAPRYDKRRYCIMMSDLKQAASFLDIPSVYDTDIKYQPFYTVDDTDGLLLTPRPALSVFGLVYDKLKGEYL